MKTKDIRDIKDRLQKILRETDVSEYRLPGLMSEDICSQIGEAMDYGWREVFCEIGPQIEDFWFENTDENLWPED